MAFVTVEIPDKFENITINGCGGLIEIKKFKSGRRSVSVRCPKHNIIIHDITFTNFKPNRRKCPLEKNCRWKPNY